MIAAETVRVIAPAKINLFLHVGAKRADGYHELESLVVFAKLGDELELEPADEISLAVEGRFAEALSRDPDNLVLKAARALADDAKVRNGARITLTKNLPVASGIGGGSADAAAALRGLAQLWDLRVAPERLHQIGQSLGSDVPVCIGSTPAWMEGRGEKLTRLDGLPEVAILLVNPGVAVPTGKVFAALKARRGIGLPLPPAMTTANELVAYLKNTANDLEAPAREIAPVVGELLDTLAAQPGALLSRMSGSGATCFALFENNQAAIAASRALNVRNPGWWFATSRIG
jgi:4-diphosphocytidyl-2-C-methyl-D-erythritol kinase